MDLRESWIAMQTRRRVIAIAILSGVVAALGHAPFDLPIFSLLGLMAAMALYLSATTWRRAFLIGWAVGFGWFAPSLHWIIEPFLVDIARHGWMAPFALVLLAGGLALLWGAGFALSARFRAGPVQAVLLLCVIWTGAEALRGVLFTGFPWALVGHVLIDTPYVHLAAYIGALGLTFALLLAAACLLTALWFKRWALVPAVGLLGLPLLVVPEPLAVGPDRPMVRLIQPNAPQHQKWDPDFIPIFYNRQLEFTRAAPAVDLVVWPETAIPYALERAGGIIAQITEAANGAGVILGAQRSEGPDYFNSLAVVGPSGALSAVYDKHHLVPFGEYIPLADLFSNIGFLGAAAQTTGGYTPGAGPEILDIGALGKALPLICYEGVFPRNLRLPGRPDWLLLITNDAWFGTFSGPYQHLAQARLRSVEQGLPMVRVANTGISAMIDPHGRILDSLPLGEAGYRDIALPAPLLPTFYSRTGDGPLLLLLVFVSLTLVMARKRSSIDGPAPQA
ncbi:apolipoprotein N-acyltransferase [Cognatishimia sp. MH4019]|uniref:apolipoprotein N-acyltransferase n=1 Tax=Cognatishimia sp. MH4019 TaxID=2854030 RepID=UPI001CD69EEC|nr:apolipoprotein N-acyltransferase [Cognatishimia sp. MH4019]